MSSPRTKRPSDTHSAALLVVGALIFVGGYVVGVSSGGLSHSFAAQMVSHEVNARNSTTVFRLDDGDAFDAPRPKNTTYCPPPPPPPLPMMYPRRCGPGSHAASRLIVAPAPRGVSASNCPDEDMYLVLWLLLLAQSGSDFHARRPLTIVDVGMNKGYSIAAMLEGLALPVPHPSANPSDWNYDSTYAKARTDALRAAAAARRTNENSAGFFSKRMLAQRLYAWYPRAARANLNGGCAEERTPSLYHPSRVLANHPVFTNRTNQTNHTTDLFIPAVEVYGADSRPTPTCATASSGARTRRT